MNERLHRLLRRGRSCIHRERVGLRALYVDVVADHCAQQSTGGGPDQPALQLVAARRGADDCARARADRSITDGVLDHLPLRGRIIRAFR